MRWLKTRLRTAIICFLAISALTLYGCSENQRSFDSSQEQAIGLYVDAMMLNELNEWDRAIRKLDEATELDPEFAMAYSLKGDIYKQQEYFEQSADAYEIATGLDPWSFRDFFGLGRVCQIMKSFLRAANAYVRACQLEPEHPE